MPARDWTFNLDGVEHRVELQHGLISGLRVILLDGKEVYRGREIIDTGGTYAFPIGGHTAALHILTQGLGVEYSLDVDGRPLDSALPQAAGQRRFRLAPAPIPDATDPAAVTAARAGILSAEQVAAIQAGLPKLQPSVVVIVVILLLVVAPILVAALSYGVPWTGSVVIGLMVIGPIVLLLLQLRSSLRRRQALGDLAAGRIEQADGTVHWKGTSTRIEAGGRSLALPSGRRPLAEGPYRFWFLPRSRLVVAAEAAPLPEPAVAAPGTPAVSAASSYFEVVARSNGFSLAEVVLNRAGRMSGRQRRHLVADDALALGGLGVASLFTAGFTASTINSFHRGAWPFGLLFLLLALVSLGSLLGGGYLLFASLVDTVLGHVSFADGQLGRERIPPSGARGSTETFQYVLGSLHFSVGRQAYDALPSPQPARVYYSRAARELLSCEPLPLLDLASLSSAPLPTARRHAMPIWLYVVTLVTWVLAVIYVLLLVLMGAGLAPPMLPAAIMAVTGGFALWDAHTGRGHPRLALLGLAAGAAMTDVGIPLALALLAGIGLTRHRMEGVR